MRPTNWPRRLFLVFFTGSMSFIGCYASHELVDRGEFEILCEPAEQAVLPGETAEVRATVDRALDSSDDFRWSIDPEEGVELSPGDDALLAAIVPSEGGRYSAVFTLRDATGRIGQCESAIVAVEGEPYLRCDLSEEYFARGRPITLAPVIVEDQGIDELSFDLVEAPEAMALPEPAGESLTFVPDVAGSYRIEFRLKDIEGHEVSCVYDFIVVEPPSLGCPSEEVTLFVGEEESVGELAIVAEAPHEAWLTSSGLDRAGWEGTIPATGRISLVIDELGTFTFMAHVRDAYGLEASCSFLARVVSRDPWVRCPRTLTVTTLEPIGLMGEAGDEDGVVVEAGWRLSPRPGGANPNGELDTNGLFATFTPVHVGMYRLTFTARDDDGRESSCTTLVRSRPPAGLYIELYWDTEIDFDLHLLHPESIDWSEVPLGPRKCSAQPGCADGPEWFEPGIHDDPRLLRDIWWGSHGPEVIHIRQPHEGSYALGAGPYLAFPEFEATHNGNAWIVIHCGPPGGTPRIFNLGPTYIGGMKFWRAGEIVVDERGDCKWVEFIDEEGGPDVCWWSTVVSYPIANAVAR